ncbi:uncharacterized protein BO97DRAFT_341484 [Aspergillus homomorphus CBS 101889]|uniref:Uncharacterized protein n=1 Tax=Aspergillus homomorphus (strain CBS 101889) TaxID=1450537 RepID=A0A395I6U9_ASPHC|nr:hypothetical protein BO97DRAFT_341484 [Aspergillus homomorphus CBS 101889]RAL13984.1 hypothetical protein BO97DRAFT_341484 [Aspergillus homomorphus CBS 101889]
MQIDGGVDFVAGGESSPDFSSSPWGLADLVEADEPSSKPTADGLATLIVNNEPLKPSRSRRKTQAKSRRKTRHYSPSDDEVYSSPSDDANGDESLDEYDMPRIKPNEKTGIVFDFSSERAKRWASAINLPGGLYNGEEQDLFFRLAMRGFEPLVPKDWRHDFPTLPESLYPPTSGPSFRPLFQVRRSSNLYATKALANLFSVGGRVRDCDIVRKRPEKLIKDAIKKYFRWAMFDADLHTTESKIPVHAIYAQKKGETTLQAVRRLNRRLRFLTSQYQKAFGLSETQTSRHFPLLIGFIICGPIVAIVTHTTDPQEIETSFDGKFISQFDLSERGQDVWNSLAIAIAVMHARRTMIGLAEEGLGGFTFCETAQPASDPDL